MQVGELYVFDNPFGYETHDVGVHKPRLNPDVWDDRSTSFRQIKAGTPLLCVRIQKIHGGPDCFICLTHSIEDEAFETLVHYTQTPYFRKLV